MNKRRLVSLSFAVCSILPNFGLESTLQTLQRSTALRSAYRTRPSTHFHVAIIKTSQWPVLQASNADMPCLPLARRTSVCFSDIFRQGKPPQRFSQEFNIQGSGIVGCNYKSRLLVTCLVRTMRTQGLWGHLRPAHPVTCNPRSLATVQSLATRNRGHCEGGGGFGGAWGGACAAQHCIHAYHRSPALPPNKHNRSRAHTPVT